MRSNIALTKNIKDSLHFFFLFFCYTGPKTSQIIILENNEYTHSIQNDNDIRNCFLCSNKKNGIAQYHDACALSCVVKYIKVSSEIKT